MVEILAEYAESELRHCAEIDASSCSSERTCYYRTVDAAMQEWIYGSTPVSSSTYDYASTTYPAIDDEARSAIAAGLAALAMMDDGDY